MNTIRSSVLPRGGNATLGATVSVDPNFCADVRERTVMDDIGALTQAIDRLDDELASLGQRIHPVLRSQGKEYADEQEPCKSPAAVCDLSALVIEMTRRVELMGHRTSRLRHDVAL